LVPIFLMGFAAIFLGFSVGFFYLQLPTDSELRSCMKTKMFGVELCPGSKSYVPLRSISAHLQRAVVLTEDSRFWQHGGFDFEEIENSIKMNLETGEYKRGGSTITQQLAKNMFLSAEKTIFRKILEAMITLRIEKEFGKKEILERYLNVVQFGKNIFGVKSASEYYFKKRPGDLTVVEAAFLAFLLPSPEKYSQSFQRRRLSPFAKSRLLEIVQLMHVTNHITDDQWMESIQDIQSFLDDSEEN
jgi:monofunctional glycosyltransferase